MEKRTRQEDEIKRHRSGQDTDIFRSILRSILFIVPVPVIIIAIAVLVSLQLMKKTVDVFEQQSMERIMNEIELSYENAILTMVQARKNDTILKYIREEKRDYYEEYKVVDALNEILSGHSDVEEVYLYLPRFDMVFSASYGVDSAAFHGRHYGNSYDAWIEQMDGSWRGSFHVSPGKGTEPMNFLSGSIGEGQYPAQIVVQINNAYLKNTMRNLCFYEGEEILLYFGNVMALTTYSEEESERIGEAVAAGIETGDTQIRIDGEKYNLQSVRSRRRDLTLVTLIPDRSSHGSVVVIKIFGSFSILLCFLLLCILAYLTARRNYRPIRKINYLIEELDQSQRIKDYKDMEFYVRNSASDMKEMRKQIVRYEEDMNHLHLSMILLKGLPVPRDNALHKLLRGQYYAVLLCVPEPPEETEELIRGGEEVLKDILYAYISEYFPLPDTSCILREGEDYYCILNGNDRDIFAGLPEQGRLLRQSMAEEEHLSCEIFLSEIYEELRQVHTGYEEVNRKREEALKQDEIQSTEDECGVDRILEVIQKNLFDQNLSVNGIADMVGMTPWQLSRMFKAGMDTGVLEYIHLCRVEQAKRLLDTQKKLRVKEAAESVGFCNVATFIRVFKKLTGVTPGQYKEMIDMEVD